jgi:hypothetical protein
MKKIANQFTPLKLLYAVKRFMKAFVYTLIGLFIVFLFEQRRALKDRIARVEKNCFSDTIQYSQRYGHYHQLKNEYQSKNNKGDST